MEDYEIEDMIPKNIMHEERRELKKFLKKSIKRKSFGAFAKGAFIGAMTALVGAGMYSFLWENNNITISKTDYVEEGYLIPSKLEDMSVENLDLSGKPETTLRYDGKDYLWKVDKDGIPICVPYEIEPPKYLPPKIITPKKTKFL